MKIDRRTSHKRQWIIAGSIIAVLAIGVGGYFIFKSLHENQINSQNSNVDYSKPSNDQINAGKGTKDSSVGSGKPSTSGSDQASSPVPQADGRGKVDASLTAANQNGSLFQIRFDIGAVTNTGTCTLTLNKGSVTLTKTAGIQALAGSSTCKGFDIPISELSAGTWQLTLHFENDSLVADTTGTAIVQ